MRRALQPMGVVVSRRTRGIDQLSSDLLQEIVRRIVDVIDPEKIILCGSRARGDEGGGSDIDILVIAESSEPRYRRSAPLYGVLSDVLIGMDIVVYTPGEAEEWSGTPQAFVTTAVREGKLLYERQN